MDCGVGLPLGRVFEEFTLEVQSDWDLGCLETRGVVKLGQPPDAGKDY